MSGVASSNPDAWTVLCQTVLKQSLKEREKHDVAMPAKVLRNFRRVAKAVFGDEK